MTLIVYVTVLYGMSYHRLFVTWRRLQDDRLVELRRARRRLKNSLYQQMSRARRRGVACKSLTPEPVPKTQRSTSVEPESEGMEDGQDNGSVSAQQEVQSLRKALAVTQTTLRRMLDIFNRHARVEPTG